MSKSNKKEVFVTEEEVYRHICDYCVYAPCLCASDPEICALSLKNDSRTFKKITKARLMKKLEALLGETE